MISESFCEILPARIRKILFLISFLIALTWFSLLVVPWNVKYRMGDLMCDYWERGAMKQYDLLENNLPNVHCRLRSLTA